MLALLLHGSFRASGVATCARLPRPLLCACGTRICPTLSPCCCCFLQKAERLKESLHFIGAPGARSGAKHTVFVDDEEEERSFDAAAYFDTPAELLDRSFNRPRREQLAQAGAVQGVEARKIEK